MGKIINGFLVILMLVVSGCSAKLSPLSPELDQKINNQDGKIDDIKNNQNGMMLELGKVRNQNDLNARDIHDAQQGLLNIKGQENNGVQILQGDGALTMVFSLITIAMMLVFYYRSKSIKSDKTTDILAQQIVLHDDEHLNDKVFMAALNTDVESNVYHAIVKNQLIHNKK